jgi:hypothetical protein
MNGIPKLDALRETDQPAHFHRAPALQQPFEWKVGRPWNVAVSRVAVRTAEGRPVAEFTGYSRTIGGPVVA